ncbi:MAG: alpha-glucan family phosphorylase [Bacteroidales bacterium]
MKEESKIAPDYVFEVSWEVCNKVGEIHTVISTKCLTMVEELRDNYILIGPDVWKETYQNPDFLEDRFLYKSWRERAESEGLRIKIGRWSIPGKPLVFLIDFTPFFSEKDKIFSHFWEHYKLDSLTGGWDYLEPALFGYAAGQVIESFYNYNLSHHDKIISHFHEWTCGTGLLYIKEKVPQSGTVFTAHSTVIGRNIAINNLPLYKNFDQYHAESIAKQFGIVSKYSLEKLAAAETDVLTTLSSLTDDECRNFLGKPADVITPNGFEDSLVPVKETYYKKRAEARNKLLQVAEALTGQPVAKSSILLLTSGPYEQKSRGYDLFIEALSRINAQARIPETVIAFIMVPTDESGPRKELLEWMSRKDINSPRSEQFLTHVLNEPDHDWILKKLKQSKMQNRPEDKVKVFYVPSILNGTDGVFNLSYYDILVGFDGTIFPSYYEPWGYSSQESLSFHIPTITTTLTGFGQWVKNLYPNVKDSIAVLNRDDDNDSEVIEEIVKTVTGCALKTEKEIIRLRIKAYEISRSALWENLISYYHEAYSLALEKSLGRGEMYAGKQPQIISPSPNTISNVRPDWKKVLVKQRLPENLASLDRIAKNLWWCWHYEGSELFEMVNREKWYELKFNPIALLESLSYKELQELSHNAEFVARLEKVTAKLENYMARGDDKPKEMIAYFSMEYGLHDTIKIFSGGLGMLAGDYLKEASDSNVNLVGIGLLYRYGYFMQTLNLAGDQIANYTPQKFSQLPIMPVYDEAGNWLKILFALPGRNLYAKIWRVDVGRIPLFLLDTDIEENDDSYRSITHQLYGGDLENRIRQEIVLGIGGIRLLDLLKIKPDVYHSNEGHSAFIGLERLRKLIQNEKLTFVQAMEVVRSSTLFTTHTPVPAGHDAFPEDMMRRYFSHYPDLLNIKWEQLLNLGRMVDNNPDEKFSMSVLAAKCSQEINGVSRIHGRVTKDLFQPLYPGYYASELHIGYVTNGVHYPTWTAKSWQQLYKKTFGEGFLNDQSNPEYWRKIQNVDDSVIWQTRQKQKDQLTEFLHQRLYVNMTGRHENPKLIFQMREAARPQALTIGFARRFATYKRAHLLFSNLDRLGRIVNNTEKPVRFLFAGKAHPNDKAGQDLIKRIIEVSRMPAFLGKIMFIENYDMELAKYLIRGVDIWLNTPTRPLEASGTSGEKAVMNGVVNFSVLDGWWAEGYRADAGWALQEEATYDNPAFQDDLDAEVIYSILEEEIVPIYYDRDSNGIPVKWISYIKNTIAEIAPHFTMKRQLDDYYRQYYSKLFKRSRIITGKNYEMARHIASWKRKVLRGWDGIEIVSQKTPFSEQKPLSLGDVFSAEIILNLNELSATDVGIEVLFGRKLNDLVETPIFIEEMNLSRSEKNIAVFECNIPINEAGVYDFAFRLFPKSPLLPHRQDFALVKWI